MKKLLSLPINLVDNFHAVTGFDRNEWFCTSDPEGHKLGSGGGTTWLLEACRREEDSKAELMEWLTREKRVLIHAGGQSRRLPGYASSGKILTPMPVFRWARGQRLSQDLLSLQLPFYEKIIHQAPSNIHTLVASGDVYIRTTQSLPKIPDADVVCYGLWADSIVATQHGVFVSNRKDPEHLDFMLQKPTLEDLSRLSSEYLFLIDTGLWLLSDRAVQLLSKRSFESDGKTLRTYDLYGEFGRALGFHPQIDDSELKGLSVAIVPLNGGEFYHFGTSRELISSTLALQNLVSDQRTIMQRKVKPHPAMFTQNADIKITLTSLNHKLWIENSFIGSNWKLSDHHVITGVPENDWHLSLSSGMCIDVVPINGDSFAAHPYGFDDKFRGPVGHDSTTVFLGESLNNWASERHITLPPCNDIFDAPLFPVCHSVEDLGFALRFMTTEPHLKAGEKVWDESEKLSSGQLSERANLNRLFAQRKKFRQVDWTLLAEHHSRSVFYQLDLADAAKEFAESHLTLPPVLDENNLLLERIHNSMFRAQVQKLSGGDSSTDEQQAFALLRQGLVGTISDEKQMPHLDVFPDQIVWGRSPVRIDLAGGWSDTPPYCLYDGGSVVNVAIELNGQPPLQVYVKPSKEYKITLRSIDMGAREILSTFDELRDYKKVGSPFSIPKAALSLAGFIPEFSSRAYASLEEQLKAFGSGIEVTLLAAIPSGSGLGTSSILSSTVLGALSDFCGLAWDKPSIAHRTLVLEQLLTTGGGWQDQYGGLFHGIKLLQTNEGFLQSPQIRWLPDYLFTDPEYLSCHLLFYTGITRTAKNILSEIVRSMFLNSGPQLRILSEMKSHALDMYETIQKGDFETFGRMVGKTWIQNQILDSGTNPSAVYELTKMIDDLSLGYKLPGAGGGGYLYIVAKDPEAAALIRHRLTESRLNNCARFVSMSLSKYGLQISRS